MGFFRKFDPILGSHFLRKSLEIMKNRAWKAIPFWDLFRDGFWMGFLWKIRVFRKTAKARIRYKNSGFSVFTNFASKTALGPLQDHFRTPNRATFWSKNLLLTFLGRFRRGPKNGPRFLTYFMLNPPARRITPEPLFPSNPFPSPSKPGPKIAFIFGWVFSGNAVPFFWGPIL